MLADNPLEDETELPLGEIVPAEWRVVVLEHTDPNGTRHIIERGMPLDEIEADFNVAIASQQDGAIEAELDPSATTELNDARASLSDAPVDLTGAVRAGLQTEPGAVGPACRAGLSSGARTTAEQTFAAVSGTAVRSALTVGSTIFVDLPEHGISADFTVREIRPCPAPSAGDGYLVTTKLIHENAEILDLRIEGSSEPIGTTSSHPFWSEDRQQFVAAGELRVGENLVLADDTTRRVESLTHRETRETVYNIEVDGEHVFYVGNDGLLVHNSCGSHLYVIRNGAGNVVYVGTGTAGRVRSATTRIANALFGGNKKKIGNKFTVTSKQFKNEFQARAMEQRLIDHYRTKGRGFLERGKEWSQDHDGLWNKQNGYDRNRLTGTDRRDKFNRWYDDEELFQIALGI